MLLMTSDMDELYRKAGENYPLNAGKPAWEALRKKMEDIKHDNNNASNKKNGLKNLLFLLLFTPLALPDVQFIRKIIFTGDNIIQTGNNIDKPGRVKQIAADYDKSISKQKTFMHKNVLERLSPFKQNLKTNFLPPKYFIRNTNSTPEEKDVRGAGAKIQSEIEPDENTETIKNEKEEQQNLPSAPGITKQEVLLPHKTKWYAGIIAGPEVSVVKMQNLHKMGFNAGIIAGVQFNQSIQLETGLLFDRKYYKSKGEYFKTDKLTLPAGTTIKEVSGFCNMIEIPLNINLIIKQKPRSNFFISGGVSSYIMKKEVYEFEVIRYGYAYPRAMNYDNPGSYAFAAINLGAGYNKVIGKKGNLRIVPSVKLPLKKMGTGSMPIQTAILYLGYTQKIF